MQNETSIRGNVCMEVEGLFYSGAFYFFNIFHSLDSILSILITFYIFKSLWKRIFFHHNLKIIVGFLLILSSLHSFLFVANTIETSTRWMGHLKGCDLFRTCAFCLFIRVPIVFSITGMVLAQTAIAIERTVASISLHEYEHQGKHLGILLTLAVLFTTITACLWLFSTDNPAELQIACGSFSDATFAKANFLYTSLLFIDTFNLTAYIMIWSRNKQLCKKSAYVTRVKYQIQENLYVLGMVFPIALSHFIVFGFDMGFLLLLRSQKENLSLKLYRTLSMLGYVIPFFTIILPITIITIEYRTQAKRRRILASTVNVDSTGEVYFRSLQLQWAQC